MLILIFFIIFNGTFKVVLAVIFAYNIITMSKKKTVYKLKKNKQEGKAKKGFWKEWGETIVFVLIVVPLIQTLIFQSYAIPTSSMESSMLVGDKLFVSKLHYGPRIPQTPIALPFLHNQIPFSGAKCYSELVSLPYMRLPGFSSIDNKDIVVFNWPDGDTTTFEYQSTVSYRYLTRMMGEAEVDRRYTVMTRPVDRRDNYVKRCLAIAGDSLQIIEGNVYINGKLQSPPENVQHLHIVSTNGNPIRKKFFIEMDLGSTEYKKTGVNTYEVHLSEAKAEKFRALTNVTNVEKVIHPKGKGDPNIFPNAKGMDWNVDNFGPIWIPQKGATIQLDSANIVMYSRAIKAYEDNEGYIVKNGQAYMDGEPINEYTFKMDYYWMMGDNRHNSQDSRVWGYVPEDHIVGTPIFVWLSNKGEDVSWGNLFSKIRWDKTFRIPK